MYNPQTPNRPQSAQQKQQPNARIAKQPSGHRGPNNRNVLNSDVTSQYQNGKVKVPADQREAILRENKQRIDK
ncbi:MAG: hypothetical protein J0M18_13705 [Ignavibacteria bacterium]|nr:hypothetical protein [Ignavibacteria bacterium]